MRAFKRNGLAISGVLILCFAWFFYLHWRSYDPTFLNLDGRFGNGWPLPSVVFLSLPSFLQCLGFSLIVRQWLSHKETIYWIFLPAVGIELLSGLFGILGTFDYFDLLAILLAYGGTFVFFNGHDRREMGRRNQSFLKIAILSSLIVTTSASTPDFEHPRVSHTPICEDADTFRSSFAVEGVRPLSNVGRIHTNGSFLLINDLYKGIHIFSNANPTNPKNLGFLKILGNTDMASTGTTLYADSGPDLLVINLDPEDIRLVERREDVIQTSQAFSNQFEDVYVPEHLISDCINSGKVIIGYEPRKDAQEIMKSIEENK